MNNPTVQEIFQLGWAEYEKHHPVPGYIREAVWHIMNCRTSALGGHVQSCPDGHYHRIWYNSCKHRSCPQCAFIQVEEWLRKQEARPLDCEWFFVTVPGGKGSLQGQDKASLAQSPEKGRIGSVGRHEFSAL